ncbi:MAG: TIGR02530 family flagellar biosynthesis protein [Oscillospiraceae bacterium]
MYIDKNYTAFVGSTPLVSNNNNNKAQASKTEAGEDFKSVLQKELQKNAQGLNFSKHAMQRINERQIEIEPKMLEQMTNAVEHAEEKGIKDALILGEQAAFIVNVPSKTVITTMNNQEMRENIITNIDGTVLL